MNNLFDYKREMTALQFTPEQKVKLAQAAASAAQKQSRRRRPILRTAVIAAALAAVLAVGSSAAGILPAPVDVFAPLFGGAVAQTEVIDKIGRPIGASDTDNGITITADAIMGDEYNAVIVYTISRDDGERFLPEGKTLENAMLTVNGFGGSSWIQGGSHGSAYFVDSDPEDNCVQYVETASSDVSMTKGNAEVEFEDFCYHDTETETFVPLYNGSWKLRFAVDYEDCSIRLGNGETFSQDGIDFTIDGITLSPIAVQVACTASPMDTHADQAIYTGGVLIQSGIGEAGAEDSDGLQDMSRALENVEILLTKKDGTVIDLSGAGGGITPQEDKTACTKGGVLEEITPLEELASISVGGIVYEIPQV